jgi:hypothetical protein
VAQEAENANPSQVPESRGFPILTAINNLRVELEAKLDRQAGEFRQEIGTLRQEIARLDSKELQKELKKLIAERDKAWSQKLISENHLERSSYSQADQEMQYQIKSQLAEAALTYKSAKEQIEIVQDQIDMMTIRAPQDGIITTWEVKKNLLGRPVDIGHELLNIAAVSPDADWELEVDVPDDDMGPVLASQVKLKEEIAAGKKPPGETLKAYWITATDPDHKYEGYVRRIASKAEMVDQKHVDKVTVGFDEAVRREYLSINQKLKPGSEVRARIDCGKTRLSYYLLRKVVQVWYESVMFRWPFLR